MSLNGLHRLAPNHMFEMISLAEPAVVTTEQTIAEVRLLLMDQWDLAFEGKCGFLPPFSRLVNQRPPDPAVCDCDACSSAVPVIELGRYEPCLIRTAPCEQTLPRQGAALAKRRRLRPVFGY